MIRSLTHCDGNFRKMTSLLSMFRAIFGVPWVMPGCIKPALSSCYEQLHQGTLSTMQLLFLPAFAGLFRWRGMIDVSMTREARIKRLLSHSTACKSMKAGDIMTERTCRLADNHIRCIPVVSDLYDRDGVQWRCILCCCK